MFDKLDDKDKKVAAVFMCFIYWRTYFRGLLPSGSDGIVVILQNTCNQTFTYEVDGAEVWFLGRGDLHDPKYEDRGIGGSVADLAVDANANAESESLTEEDVLDQEGCRYSIRVYPSQEFEDSKTTNGPEIQAITLAALFLFTSGVLLLYEYMIQRRQRAMMKSAQQTGKLVHDLFPEAVRERLLEEQDAQDNNQRPSEGIASLPLVMVKTFSLLEPWMALCVGPTSDTPV